MLIPPSKSLQEPQCESSIRLKKVGNLDTKKTLNGLKAAEGWICQETGKEKEERRNKNDHNGEAKGQQIQTLGFVTSTHPKGLIPSKVFKHSMLLVVALLFI